jgi:hypothetical protein
MVCFWMSRRLGCKSYQLRYWYEGKSRWKHLSRVGAVRLGVVIKTAKRDLVNVEVDKRDLVAERQAAKAAGTFDDLYKLWFEKHTTFKKSSEAIATFYKRHIKERIGDRMVADTKQRDVRDRDWQEPLSRPFLALQRTAS